MWRLSSLWWRAAATTWWSEKTIRLTDYRKLLIFSRTFGTTGQQNLSLFSLTSLDVFVCLYKVRELSFYINFFFFYNYVLITDLSIYSMVYMVFLKLSSQNMHCPIDVWAFATTCRAIIHCSYLMKTGCFTVKHWKLSLESIWNGSDTSSKYNSNFDRFLNILYMFYGELFFF